MFEDDALPIAFVGPSVRCSGRHDGSKVGDRKVEQRSESTEASIMSSTCAMRQMTIDRLSCQSSSKQLFHDLL